MFWFKKSAALVGAAILASATLAVPASALTLDFDTGSYTWDTNGFLTGYSQGGLSFGISHSGVNSDGATLFNAVCPGVNPNGQASECRSPGDDRDLIPVPGDEDGIVGNILIRQERGRTNADDASGQGSITFTLLSGPMFRVLGFSAVDNEDFAILVDGVEQGRIDHSDENETTALTFINPSPVTSSFTVRYFGSGGVDSIVLAPIPLPAGLPLLLAGIGGLALVRRRRKS